MHVFRWSVVVWILLPGCGGERTPISGSVGGAGSNGNGGSGGSAASGPGSAGVGTGTAGTNVGTAGLGAGTAGTNSAGGAAGGSTGAAGTMTSSSCPPSAPSSGDGCSQEGLVCEWGVDFRGDPCRTIGTCSSQRWRITQPYPGHCRPFPGVGTCQASLEGMACATDSTCTKADGNLCVCSSCPPNLMSCQDALVTNSGSTGLPGAPSWTWYCPRPVLPFASSGDSCPPIQPDLGATCTPEGVICKYDQFVCGQPDKVCSHGTWIDGQRNICP
jgi:hypothetical protein